MKLKYNQLSPADKAIYTTLEISVSLLTKRELQYWLKHILLPDASEPGYISALVSLKSMSERGLRRRLKDYLMDSMLTTK